MQATPDAAILITANHDVTHKSLYLDLERSLAAKGDTIKVAISAERDKYLKHHRGFGGTSYVYLRNQKRFGQDKSTVFGDLDSALEALPADYHTHGSLHETAVPLFIYNARDMPGRSYFRCNIDLARWLYGR